MERKHANPEWIKAFQFESIVVLVACGQNLTAGYKVFFEQSIAAVHPPIFNILELEPVGPVPEVITPYVVATSFVASDKIKVVKVETADGTSSVVVEDARLS